MNRRVRWAERNGVDGRFGVGAFLCLPYVRLGWAPGVGLGGVRVGSGVGRPGRWRAAGGVCAERVDWRSTVHSRRTLRATRPGVSVIHVESTGISPELRIN